MQGKKQEREGNAPCLLKWLYKLENIIGGCLFIKLLLKGALKKSDVSESLSAAKCERLGVLVLLGMGCLHSKGNFWH